MNYQETLDYLFSQLPMFQRIGAAAYRTDMGNTIAICEVLGNPQNYFKSIHIAGTNGKGSVSHMLASVLQESGYKTGLYTSPHLKDFRERIKINGKMIERDYVVSFVERYRKSFEAIKPSFFEMTVGLAFDYFKNEKVDVAVIETGMGGRLDSTNIITPELSVITNIGYDHMQFLGDSLGKIAGEKAGIIKQGVPVIIGERQTETTRIFKDKATEKESAICWVEDFVTVKPVDTESVFKDGINHRLYKVNINEMGWDETINLSLLGDYQQKNLRTAIYTAMKMRDTGFEIDLYGIKRGIENVVQNTDILGRFQIINQEPLIVCDIAHNYDGISLVMKQLSKLRFKTMHFVLGMVNDKAIDSILKILPTEAMYYFCKADIPRGLAAEILLTKAKEFGLKGDAYPSVILAYTAARSKATSHDMIFIGGSTFTVAEVI